MTGAAPSPGRIALPPEEQALLEASLAPLAELRPDWPSRLLRYVREGEGDDVLAELAQDSNSSWPLSLTGAHRAAHRAITLNMHLLLKLRSLHIVPARDVLARLGPGRPLLVLRLAKLYQAALGQGPGPERGPGDWLEVLVGEVADRGGASTVGDAAFLEEVLALDGAPPELLYRNVFLADPKTYKVTWAPAGAVQLRNFGARAAQYPDVLRAALGQSESARQVHALDLLAQQGIDPQPFADEIVRLATASARSVRQAAGRLLSRMSEAAVPRLQERACTGAAGARAAALEALAGLAGRSGRAFLQERLAQEKAPKVQQVLRQLLGLPERMPAADAPAAPPAPPPPPALPALPPIAAVTPLTPVLRQAFQQVCDALHAEALDRFQQVQGRLPPASTAPPPLAADDFATACGYLEKGRPAGLSMPLDWLQWANPRPLLRGLLEHPDLQPAAAVRLLRWAGICRPMEYERGGAWFFWPDYPAFLQHYAQHHDLGFALGMRELGVLFQAAGLDPTVLGRSRLEQRFGLSPQWPSDQTWPYFAEHLELLEEALDLRAREQPGDDLLWNYLRGPRRQAAFEVLAMFPRLPERFEPLCWQLALGGARSERALARAALASVPDKLPRILAALADGKQETRAAAADWLGQLGDRAAVAPLQQALAREKHDLARGAFMAALERLGVPAAEFLDRSGLLREAAKGLARGVPDELGWLPLDLLPAVHWRDTGEAVPAEVLRWWLVQGYRSKNPEPGVLLRCYAAHLRRDEAEVLGQFVLEAWIRQDTRPCSRAEAEQRAQQFLGVWGGMQPAAQASPLYQQMLETCLHQPADSAIASKGVLAVAGACAGGRAAGVVEEYLRTWYGQRAAQCKALLQMLAWIDHPAAIQLLLATAKRFRTRGIREQAERLVHELAERRGWTVQELADRNVSTCGLDARGELVLDYGPRRFVARLSDDLEWSVTDADGKTLAALPAARKSDDADKAQAARETFAAARKELKAVLRQQEERLYEAMCVQRAWPFPDWQDYLHRHPLVGRLCQRLVWTVHANDRLVATCRPLADGSLTGPDDEEVTVTADATLRLAHACTVPPEVAERWQRHLADYEVVPLFEQLGKEPLVLDAALREQTALTQFQGHLLEAYTLRGRAARLGYTRGSAEDGGYFYQYHKHFPALELAAVIQFTGNQMPEENHVVALEELHFVRRARPGDEGASPAGLAPLGETRLRLGDVPAVLLTECFHDLRTIAAAGTGFDPEWRTKAFGGG